MCEGEKGTGNLINYAAYKYLLSITGIIVRESWLIFMEHFIMNQARFSHTTSLKSQVEL